MQLHQYMFQVCFRYVSSSTVICMGALELRRWKEKSRKIEEENTRHTIIYDHVAKGTPHSMQRPIPGSSFPAYSHLTFLILLWRVSLGLLAHHLHEDLREGNINLPDLHVMSD